MIDPLVAVTEMFNSRGDRLVSQARAISTLNDKLQKSEQRIRGLAMELDRWKSRAQEAEAQLASLGPLATRR